MSLMAEVTKERRSRRRNDRRFRPVVDPGSFGSVLLEGRQMLSGGVSLGLDAGPKAAHAIALAARASRHAAKVAHAPKRLTPAQEVNAQYTAFVAAFNQQLNFYIQSLTQQSSGSVTVSTTLSSAYAPPSPLIEVDDASVFGPPGFFNPNIVATATLGTAPPLGQFTLTGSSGNTLTINVAASSPISLPEGTLLTASVSTSAQSAAASIFPSYITNSTTQLAINLVKYFNSLPIRLPKENAPPHTPVQRGAIQKFVFQSIASGMSNSLQQLLLAIPLPTTAGADLSIYMSTVNSAVALSLQTVTGGIQQIYAGKLLISATPPANRLGETFNTGTSSSSSTSTTTGSSSTAA
jgi:hypothetical protein